MDQRRWVILVVLASCGFEPAPLSGPVDAGAPEVDAQMPPEIHVVVIGGTEGRRRVHQGASDVTVVLRGRGLRGAEVSIGGAPLTVLSDTDDAVAAMWDVPHGAALGGRTLAVNTGHGSYLREEALEVTPITVAAGAPQGDGTPDAPYASLEQALGLAQDGDQVLLLGAYFTLGTAVVPSGVELRGSSGARLESDNPIFPPATGVVLMDRARLSALDIFGFPRCIEIKGIDAVVHGVGVAGCGVGLMTAEGSSAALTALHVDDTELVAIQHEGTALSVDDLTLYRNGATGIRAKSGGITIDGGRLDHEPDGLAGLAPLFWDDRPAAATSTILLRNVTMDGATLPPGIYEGSDKGPREVEGADGHLHLRISNATLVTVE
jgi:hypothetical protein